MYRTVRRLDDREAAYVTGLIDGERTVSLPRKHRGENRQLVVSISNTELPRLEHVVITVGAGKITRKMTYRPNHTPSATYVVTNRQALALLDQVTPYLRSYKAERSKVILEHYVELTPRNGQYDASQKERPDGFVRKVLSVIPAGSRSRVARDA